MLASAGIVLLFVNCASFPMRFKQQSHQKIVIVQMGCISSTQIHLVGTQFVGASATEEAGRVGVPKQELGWIMTIGILIVDKLSSESTKNQKVAIQDSIDLVKAFFVGPLRSVIVVLIVHSGMSLHLGR